MYNYAMRKLIACLLLILFVLASVFAEEPETPVKDRPSVALVLSGGGAKGIAHIPIIEALERYGIPIDKVFGTSMGALIGGLYAAGLSPGEMREIVVGNDLTQLFTVFDSEGYTEVLDAFDFNSNNVLSLSLGQGIGGINGFIDDYLVLNFFNKFIGNVPDELNFDTDLVVPFECNAADMITGDEYVFREGNLITAMRSSMSLPLIFEPVILSDGSVFMDGGIVSNYIVHRAVEEGYDIIIVVTLNAYGKNKLTVENYSSLSGTASSTLTTVLNNVSKGEVDMADYWFSPDLSGYGTLSFAEAIGILERGDREAEEQKAKLEEIAALFTEDQKEYKDPNRVGEYHTKFTKRTKAELLSTREQRHEDLLGRTRVSLGLYGSGGYGFFFAEKEDADTSRALYPVLSLRSFIKDIGASRFSFDIRLKLQMSRTTDLSFLTLYRLTPDYGERLYAIARVKTEIGSRSFFTDKSATYRWNVIEGLVAVDAGAMLTNGKNFNLQLFASAENSWDFANLEIIDTSIDLNYYALSPTASLEFVYYPGYSNGFFSKSGARVDFLAKAGYNIRIGEWFYKLGLSGEYTFRLSDKTSLWLEANGYSSRCSLYQSYVLRSMSMEYGGWEGMPGYATGVLYGEFIHGGFGLQFNLTSGFVSSFIAVVVRAGIKGTVKYGWTSFEVPESMVPFTSLRKDSWDLGISLGYGVSTPVGDLVFGVGFNKNLQLALYVEMT